MRIVMDGRLWSESGLGRYIRNLVRELQEIDKLNDYYVLLLEKDFKTVVFCNRNFHKVLADFKWYGFEEQFKLLWLLKSLKPDLVHFAHFNVPILYKGKFVVTIHDLIHQHFQTRQTTAHNPFIHEIKKRGYRAVFSHAVKGAVVIITPSEFVKKQLQKEWKVKEDKVVVTYEGVDEDVVRLVGETKEKDFDSLKKFGISKPYLFYIGNAQPHKNLLGLIRGFRELRDKYPGLLLVLSGPDHYFWQKIKKETEAKVGMIFTGFVTDKEMVVLYKNAKAYVFPSLEEGFGIPLLEAMACSCPVVSSNAGSLPEVGGDAAAYFDPKDVNDMVEKISHVLNDNKLRQELMSRGKKRYKQFSWKKMAEETLKVYQSVGAN